MTRIPQSKLDSISQGANTTSPENRNPLSIKDIRFVLDRLPNVTFFAQRVNIPSIIAPSIEVTTPGTIKNIFVSGDSAEYSDLSVDILIDEDLASVIELHKWFRQTRGIFNADEVQKTQSEMESDGSVLVYTNQGAPNLVVRYMGLQPESIGDITLDLTEGEPSILTLPITFKYDYYEIRTTT